MVVVGIKCDRTIDAPGYSNNQQHIVVPLAR